MCLREDFIGIVIVFRCWLFIYLVQVRYRKYNLEMEIRAIAVILPLNQLQYEQIET